LTLPEIVIVVLTLEPVSAADQSLSCHCPSQVVSRRSGDAGRRA
jgi:hypothetical protein